MGRLDGKAAIVTGGSGGIGGADCELFAKEGAKVVIADIAEEAGEALAEKIRADGGEAVFMKLDVTDEQNWKDVIAATVGKYGKLNVLVNNAGASHEMDIEEMSADEWDWHIQLNLTGTYYGMKYAIEVMKDNDEYNSIVNRSSIGRIIGVGTFPAYGAAKAGVANLSKSVALSCGKKHYKIRVNSVLPGCIKTALTAKDAEHAGLTPEEYYKKMAERVPIGYVGEPIDIAYGDLYLASDESKFVDGEELVIDGGWTIQ